MTSLYTTLKREREKYLAKDEKDRQKFARDKQKYENDKQKLEENKQKLEENKQKLEENKLKLENDKNEMVKEMLLDNEPLEKIMKYSKFTKTKIKQIEKELLAQN